MTCTHRTETQPGCNCGAFSFAALLLAAVASVASNSQRIPTELVCCTNRGTKLPPSGSAK